MSSNEPTLPGIQSPPKALNATDFGNAERFAALHGWALRYVTDMGLWLKWTGTLWRQVSPEVELVRSAKEVVRILFDEARTEADENRRSERIRHALKSESLPRISAMIKLASAEPVFEVAANELDKETLLMTCKNGTVDLKTGALRAPNRADLITRGTRVDFDPDAKAPRWDSFLNEVMGGREDLVEFIRRAFGYSLTGRIDAHCFFLLHGDGCNGKSLLMSVLLDLLGDSGQTAPFDTFAKTTASNAIPNDIAAMRGARVVVASEGEEGARLDESKIKQLTGGDQISARFMRGEFFNFHPVLKLWLATNHRPDIRGTGPAIWRRMRLVPFDVDFLGREDPELLSKLLLELPGILAWAVRGCRDWLADGGGTKGLNVSEIVRRATEAYREDSDVFGQFLQERTLRPEFACVTSKSLFADYLSWSESSNYLAVTSQALGREMSRRGFPTRSSNGQRLHRGIGLRSGKQQEHSDP